MTSCTSSTSYATQTQLNSENPIFIGKTQYGDFLKPSHNICLHTPLMYNGQQRSIVTPILHSINQANIIRCQPALTQTYSTLTYNCKP